MTNDQIRKLQSCKNTLKSKANWLVAKNKLHELTWGEKNQLFSITKAIIKVDDKLGTYRYTKPNGDNW